MDSQGSVEWHARTLRAWHLAILRFAVTLDNADGRNVLAIANEIDRLGRENNDQADFGFFRTTSSELCAAILQQNDISSVTLRQYLARIDDVRLRRALAAALDIELSVSIKNRSKLDSDLWKGLPSRAHVERAP
jgi:hypothetical protein